MTFSQFLAAESVYSAIYLLTLSVLGLTVVFISTGSLMSRKQKIGFAVCALLIVLTSTAEWLGEYMNDAGTYRALHLAVKFFELSMTPTIPFLMGFTIGQAHRWRWFLLSLACSLLAQAALLPGGLVFFLDENNRYQHGKAYWVYPVLIGVSVLFLGAEFLLQTKKLQNHKYGFAFLIVLLPAVCFCAHIADPQIRLSWLGFSVSLSLLYNYYCNVFLSTDHLTSLLNRGSFDNDVERLRRGDVLIELDIDKFKALNDTYGHLAGDKYLCEISSLIYTAYKDVGRCYRIGGDEFAVIIRDQSADVNRVNETLFSLMDQKRKTDPLLPRVSLGFSVYSGNGSAADVYREADMKLYENKLKLTDGQQEE